MQNQLMVFSREMFSVKVKEADGEILFDAESVAKSLGITTVAKSGNACVRWSRVNEYLKNFPKISAGSFIPEAAVYKLAFKANNALAEKFQDWLALEVLPSIRRTGSYSVAPEKKQEQGYTVKPTVKHYKGEPVITLRDLAYYAGVGVGTMRFYFNSRKHGLTEGVDYIHLTGKELDKFKKKNRLDRLISTLIIITKSGFLKLAKSVSGMPKQLECFTPALPPAARPSPVRMLTDTPNTPEAQKYVGGLLSLTQTLENLLKYYNRYNEEEEHMAFLKSIHTVGVDIFHQCNELKRLNVNMVEKVW